MNPVAMARDLAQRARNTLGMGGLPGLPARRVSLSLEGPTLRVVACQGRRVTAWSSVPFNRALTRNGLIANPAGMAQVVRAVLSRSEFQTRRVLVALPGLQSLCRVLTLPPARGINPAIILPREATRQMSFAPDTSYLFWQKIPDGVRPRFLAVTVPREPLLNLIETVSLAGARVGRVDLKPFCLGRATNLTQAIVANAEPGSLDLVIISRGVPAAVRSLYLGDEAYLPEVLLPRLADELERFTAFFDNANPNEALSQDLPVQLSGSVAHDPSAATLIHDATGRPVQPPQPPLALPPDFPVHDFAVNLGLLLKEV